MPQYFNYLSRYSFPFLPLSSPSQLEPPVPAFLDHQGTTFLWKKAPYSQGPPHSYCTLQHQLQTLQCRVEQVWFSPCTFTMTIQLPSPEKANFQICHKLSCCAPLLDPLLSGIFVLWVSSALLFLASMKRVLEAFSGPEGTQTQTHLILTGLVDWPGSSKYN